MERVLNILRPIAIVAAIVLAGILVGWLGTRTSSTAARVQTSVPVTAETEPAPPAQIPRWQPVNPPVDAAAQTDVAARAPSESEVLTSWAEQLENILNAEVDLSSQETQMLALFPNLPPEGQVHVSQYLSSLLPDADYPALAQYLTNSTTPESVQNALFSGLLNRPNKLKLPFLLDIARDDQNPKADEARALLEAFLDQDYGQDWSQWQTQMNQWLANNPD